MQPNQPVNTPTVETLEGTQYKIELTTNSAGNPVGRYYKLLSAGINKGQYKLLENFRFSSEERRKVWIDAIIASAARQENEKADMKIRKQQIRAEMQHGFQVGEIFYESWGYDQTNIDFYQLVEVSKKSVLLQRIGATRTSRPAGMDAAWVVPNPASKCGPPERKIIQFRLHRGDSRPIFYIKAESGTLIRYDAGTDGLLKTSGH